MSQSTQTIASVIHEIFIAMIVFIIVVKVIVSLVCTGFLIAGFVKLFIGRRKPDISPAIERFVGIFGMSYRRMRCTYPPYILPTAHFWLELRLEFIALMKLRALF